MKIAIPSDDKTIIADHFGRAKFFMVYDTENSQIQILDNQENAQSPQGAGIQAANMILEAKAEVLITNDLGPKAEKVIKGSSLKVIMVNSREQLNIVIDKFKSSEYK